MAFKTQAEIWEHLLKGGVIIENRNGFKVRMGKCGNPLFEDGSEPSYLIPEHWLIYEEPKPKKKVTLYRYTYREDNGPDIEQTNWVSYGFKEGWSNHFTLLKTESKEVEYDDV